MEKINIEKLNEIYNIIINNNNISYNTKKQVIYDLYNKIDNYYCYKNGETSCPYSVIKSVEYFDGNNKETMIMCNYYNIAACSYNKADINDILSCPVKKLKKEFKSFIEK